jgi:hypothetical protein
MLGKDSSARDQQRSTSLVASGENQLDSMDNCATSWSRAAVRAGDSAGFPV